MTSLPSCVGVSPKAKRPRVSWFLRVIKILDTYQFEIGYKNVRGEVSAYSKTKSAPKIPFGPPVKCEYFLRKSVDGETMGAFHFTNKRRESAVFYEPLMNCFNVEGGVNDFSKKMTSMIMEKKQKLLAFYLSLLSHTRDFVHHREELQDKNGFMIDDDGIQERDLQINGGCLAEFEDFVEIAKSSSLVVENEDGGVSGSNGNPLSKYFQQISKKSKNSISPPKKKTKADLRNENEQREIEDTVGLEQKYIKSYHGLAKIPLESISVAPELKLQVNMIRVRSIAESMKKYDPSLSVLVVCPENLNEEVNLTDVKAAKFHCIQKIHTLEAFRHLDKEGKFQNMFGHSDRKVTCYVIKIEASGLIQYGHLRPTSIENQFVKKIHPQHLLHIFNSLIDQGDLNAQKVVERMTKLCRIGANEATSISKLCTWSRGPFTELIRVVELFEKYETLDVTPGRHQGRLARGEKFHMTNQLFNQLAKLDENYFLSGCPKILSKQISLKCLVEEYGTLLSMDKVTRVLSVLAGHKTYEQIKQEFPGKFDLDQMKTFIGAEIKEGKILNENASRLEKYFDAVTREEPDSALNILEFHEFEGLQELKDENVFVKFDTVLLLLSQDNQDTCLEIADNICKSEAQYKSAIIIFPSEVSYFQFMSYIRGKDTSYLKHFEVKPLVISCEPQNRQVFEENAKFGVIFGIFDGFKTPIKLVQSSISDLKCVIESISPPGGSIMVVSERLPLVKVHNTELLGKVAYYGSKHEISRLKQLLSKDGNFQRTMKRSGSDFARVEPKVVVITKVEDKVKADAQKVFDFDNKVNRMEEHLKSD